MRAFNILVFVFVTCGHFFGTAFAQPAETSETAEVPPNPAALDPDDAACSATKLAEERRIKRDVLPAMRAESKAVKEMIVWFDRTYHTLFPILESIGEKKKEAYLKDYENCISSLTETKTIPLPHCAAWLSQDTAVCDSVLMADEKSKCVQFGSSLRTRFLTVVDWLEKKMDPKECTDEYASNLGLGSVGLCKAFAAASDCNNLEVKPSVEDICEALQAGKKGSKCGGQYPKGSMLCDIVKLGNDKNPWKACQNQWMSGNATYPAPYCHLVKIFSSEGCTVKTLAMAKEVVSISCKFFQSLKAGNTSCKGILPENSFPCALYLALAGTLAGKPGLCEELTDEELLSICEVFSATRVEDCPKDSVLNYKGVAIDGSECRKPLWKTLILPATEGRTEVRLSISNLFSEEMLCTATISWESEMGTSSVTRKITVPGGEFVNKQFYVLPDNPESKIEVNMDCKWSGAVWMTNEPNDVPRGQENQ